jgi:hypothetical protein
MCSTTLPQYYGPPVHPRRPLAGVSLRGKASARVQENGWPVRNWSFDRYADREANVPADAIVAMLPDEIVRLCTRRNVQKARGVRRFMLN